MMHFGTIAPGLFLLLLGVSEGARPANESVWYRLGSKACYGTTCKFDQFCSDDLVWHTCRNCTVIEPWCTLNMTHVQVKYPSCAAMCERLLAGIVIDSLQNRTNDLQNQRDDLQSTVTRLNSDLTKNEKALSQANRDLNATGIALKTSIGREADLQKKLNESVHENANLGHRANELEGKLGEQGQKVENLMWAFIGTTILLFISLVAACICLYREHREKVYLLTRLSRDGISTASTKSSLLAWLLCPFCFKKTGTPPAVRPKVYAQTSSGPDSQETRVLITNVGGSSDTDRTTAKLSSSDTDSGNGNSDNSGSNSHISSNSHSSSESDMVAVSGDRTQHHMDDVKDFSRHTAQT